MNLDQTRKHIHDLANTFSIIDASVHKTLKLLNQNHPDLKEEIQRLEMANDYIKKSIQTLRDLRTEVHNQLNTSK